MVLQWAIKPIFVICSKHIQLIPSLEITMLFSSLLVVTASLVSQVAAHGYVPFIKINGQTIAGWNVNTGKN